MILRNLMFVPNFKQTLSCNSKCFVFHFHVNRLHIRVYRTKSSIFAIHWFVCESSWTSLVGSCRPYGTTTNTQKNANFTYGRGIYKCLRKVGLSKNDRYQKLWIAWVGVKLLVLSSIFFCSILHCLRSTYLHNFLFFFFFFCFFLSASAVISILG